MAPRSGASATHSMLPIVSSTKKGPFTMSPLCQGKCSQIAPKATNCLEQHIWGLFKIPFPDNYPCASLGRILREHSKTTCSIQIKCLFTSFRGCVCVCKPLSQAESLQTTGQGASDPFLDLPRVCLFAALQLPFFQTLCRNSWLKEVDMASSVLHTFGRARILREPCVDFDPVLATFRSIWLKHYEAYLKPESV